MKRTPLRRRTRLQTKTRLRFRRKARGKEAVKIYPDGREVCCNNPAGDAEYARRRDAMYLRQGGLCVLCGEFIAPDTETFEHQDGRNRMHRDERIWRDGKPYNGVSHGLCNSLRGSQRTPFPFQVSA